MSFTINGSLLKKYHPEPGETLVDIPEGITAIADRAFYDCKEMVGINFPDSIQKIGSEAFRSCGRLTRVVLPPGLKVLEEYVFGNCLNLRAASLPASLARIGEGAFLRCFQLSEVNFPSKLIRIDKEAFWACESLMEVNLPTSIEYIGDEAFGGWNGRKEVILPSCTIEIGKNVFHKGTRVVLPEACYSSGERMDDDVTSYLSLLTEQEAAYIILHQEGEAWEKLVSQQFPGTLKPQPVLNLVLKQLQTDGGSPAQLDRLAGFIDQHTTLIDEKGHRAALALLVAKHHPMSEMLEKHPAIQSALQNKVKHPVEQLVLERMAKEKLNTQDVEFEFTAIPFQDTQEPCSREVMTYLLSSYPPGFGRWSQKIRPWADKVAAALDQDKLLAYLKKYIYGTNHMTYLGCYCRYASPRQIQELLDRAKSLKKSSNNDRWKDSLNTALFLSDTREAMLALEEGMNKTTKLFASLSELNDYARMRKVPVEKIRNELLYNFGLDANGMKVYDLGSVSIQVQMNTELQLDLINLASGQMVKSLPKQGSDPELYAAAEADLADLSRNLKKATRTRIDVLLKGFLEGSEYAFLDWTEASLGDNPVLRQIASLLVWEQAGRTFTVLDKKTVDASGQEIALEDNQPIILAHPMEMMTETVQAWQRYFADRELKQPFAQVWEPITDLGSVTPDRYQGSIMPLHHFNKQESRGIFLDLDYLRGRSDWRQYARPAKISFLDLEVKHSFMNIQGNEDIMQLLVLIEELPRFLQMETVYSKEPYDLFPDVVTLQYTAKPRRINHYIAFLDRLALTAWVKQDQEQRVAGLLTDLTLAQVLEMTKIAIDHNSTKVTAILLEHRHKYWSDYQSLEMDELTLEDWDLN